MKNLLMIAMFAGLLCTSVGCQPKITSGVNFDNQNEASVENALIRVWVLDEEQIQNPPATRAEAEALPFIVTAPFNEYEFLREQGNYFAVAANESHFQSLAADDAFTPGEDFSLLGIAVPEGEEKVKLSVINSDSPTLLPVIAER